VSWPDAAGDNRFLIALVYAVDEAPIPGLSRVKVETEGTIDKRINHIAETDKKLELEILEQQRQDVLRPDTLKTLHRAIPVLIKLLITLKLPIKTVGWRQLPPELTHYLQRLRPALMSIAADHVRDDKRAVGFERTLDLGEQILQIEDMMQRLIGDHGVIWMSRSPCIEIRLNEVDVGGKPSLRGGNPASFKHVGIQIETIDDEIVVPGCP